MAKEASHKEEIDGLEKDLEELRRRHDMYFQGSKEQRTPPTTQAAQFGGVLRRLREDQAKGWNTGERFRLNQLHARYVSYERMWARTLKEIEDGTSKRDRFRLKRKHEEAPPATTSKATPAPSFNSADSFDVDVGGFDEPSDERPAPPRPPAALPQQPASRLVERPVAAAASAEGMNEQRMKQLYDVYMQAKKRTGEQSTLTLDGLRSQIAKQVPAIKAKHNCQTVDFKVVLKDGKAMLKAIPK